MRLSARKLPILAVAVVVALALLAVVIPADSGRAEGTVRFVRGTVTGSGFTTVNPTAITFGPDGRLYVADWEGRIQALDLDPVSKAVTGVEEVASNADLQEVLGIAFDPNETESPPPVYVTNTVSEQGSSGPAPAGSYPGKVTKIHGTAYAIKTDIITGLPIGTGHQSNGLAFADDGTLYIAQGGPTNAGLPGGPFARSEGPLSGALLVANPSVPEFDGNIIYDPPDTYGDTVDQISGDVSVYAPGLRNPYDLVIHSNGRIYATDNGPNALHGSASTGCDTEDEDPWSPDTRGPDELNLIEEGNYYGHPNRNRGRFDPRQCVYHSGTDGDGPDWTGPLALLPASSNGLVEYTAGTFGGQLRGNLFYVGYVDGVVGRIVLSPDGTAVTSHTVFDSSYENWNILDITMGEDGTLYIAEFGANRITFLKPDESTFIPGVLNANAAVDRGQDRRPQVTTDGAGAWVAVWDSQDNLGGTIGYDFDILVARSTDSGVTWTAPVALNTKAAGDDSDDRLPQVTTDGAGNWVAVWRSDDALGGTIGADFDILVARSTDNGATWTAPAALNTNAATDSGEDSFPQITTDGAGNWVAVWGAAGALGGTIGSDFDILVARSTDSGTTWTAPVALNTNAAVDSGNDRRPQVVTDGAGTWVALWGARDRQDGVGGANLDVLVARSMDNGATWTAPAIVYRRFTEAAAEELDHTHPELTTDGAGNLVAIWGSRGTPDGKIGTNLDIQTARSTDDGATWTTPAILSTLFTEAAVELLGHTHPQVTTDGAGNWVAIWESRGTLTGSFDIRAALSTNNGGTWTAPFVYIDTSQGGADIHVQMTTDGTGNWLTVWESPDSLDGTIGADFDILSRTDILGVFDLLGAKPTPTSTPTVTPTPTKQPEPGDTDGDGCSDQRENGADEKLGGQRDYKNPWDFYDVLGAGFGPPDGIVDLSNDIFSVLQSYSPTGAPPYNVLYDRGPTTGPNVWNMTAPDGVIDLSNDILGVIQQYLHDCR